MEWNSGMLSEFSTYSAKMPKGLAKITIYSLILSFFIIYQFYLLSHAGIIFAATPSFVGNESTPVSPATYSNSTNKSFSVVIDTTSRTVAAPVDPNGVIFQIGRNISSAYTNFTKCATPVGIACTWNTSPSVFIINFTAQTFDQAGISNYTWFANDSSGFGNATQTIQYTLNKAIPTLVLSNNTASVNTSGMVGYWRFEEGSGTSVADSSGNSNTGTLYTWQYNKPITISNSGSALTNYQIKFTMDTATPISQGKMRSDCGDLRVKDSDGTTDLSYWIEAGCNSASTVVWAKVPSVPSGSKTIYVYYGNPSATSLSTTNTFVYDISNLGAAWKLDEGSGTSASDSSGNGNTGTLYGSPTWVTGKFVNAVQFSGSTSQYFKDATDSFHNAVMSVGMWVKTTSSSGATPFIYYASVDAYYGWHIDINGATFTPEFVFTNPTGGPICYVTASKGVSDGIWHYIAATNDGTNLKIYIDGVLNGTAASCTPVWTTGMRFYMGTDRPESASSPKFGYPGSVDEVQIFSQALSASQISAIYSNYAYATSNYTSHDLVRAYSSPEPTTSAGTEQTLSMNWTTGMFGNGLSFDGASNYVNISDSPSLNPTSFTASAWIKPMGPISSYPSILSKTNSFFTLQTCAEGEANGTSVTFWINNQGNGNTCMSNTSIYYGNWYLVTLTYDGSTAKEYFNGQLMYQQSFSVTPSSSTSLTIGGYPGIGNRWNGTIDEVQIWNRALTASEINELHESSTFSTTVTGSNCPTGLGAADVTCTLYRNLTSVTNPDIPTAGYYYYLYNTSGGANYTMSSILLPINVTQGPQVILPTVATIFLNSSKAWWNDSVYSSGSAVYTNGTIDSGDTFNFYLNGINQCSGTTNSNGGWSCTFQAPIEINSYEAKISLVTAAASNSTTLRVWPNYGATPSGTSDRAVIEVPYFVEDMNGKLKTVIVRITTWKS